MSTTFDVLPGTGYISSFREVVERAEVTLNAFLGTLHVQHAARFDVGLHRNDTNARAEVGLDAQMRWSGDVYAWFSIRGVPGGTDAGFWPVTEWDREMWRNEVKTSPRYAPFASQIERSLQIGHGWHFRRSAGQPGIINIAYGHLAAALADITDGLVYTDDGAWDYERFPATADDFRSWFMRPQFALSENCREWATRCTADLDRDFTC